MRKVLMLMCGLFFLQLSCASDPTYEATKFIIEPQAGITPFINLIDGAHQQLDVVIYELSSQPIINALLQAKQRGVNVRVLIQEQPYGNPTVNQAAIQTLTQAGITVVGSDPAYQLTHQKTLIIDDRELVIMTLNLTDNDFNGSRNFAVMDDDSHDVYQAEAVFNADTNRSTPNITPSALVWSPVNTRTTFADIIDHAHASLAIYAFELTDYDTVGEIASASRRGVHVRIIMNTSASTQYAKYVQYLQHNGVAFQFVSTPFIHAKVIMADQGTDSGVAYIGSANISEASIDDNRELGIQTHNALWLSLLAEEFNQDWSQAVAS
jgi:phosphatidylserine/phosphatidylglycerophosphate/cardiolipin synthase-like enzyme